MDATARNQWAAGCGVVAPALCEAEAGLSRDMISKAAGRVALTAGRESAGQGAWTRYSGAQSAWSCTCEDIVVETLSRRCDRDFGMTAVDWLPVAKTGPKFSGRSCLGNRR